MFNFTNSACPYLIKYDFVKLLTMTKALMLNVRLLRIHWCMMRWWLPFYTPRPAAWPPAFTISPTAAAVKCQEPSFQERVGGRLCNSCIITIRIFSRVWYYTRMYYRPFKPPHISFAICDWISETPVNRYQLLTIQNFCIFVYE